MKLNPGLIKGKMIRHQGLIFTVVGVGLGVAAHILAQRSALKTEKALSELPETATQFDKVKTVVKHQWLSTALMLGGQAAHIAAYSHEHQNVMALEQILATSVGALGAAREKMSDDISADANDCDRIYERRIAADWNGVTVAENINHLVRTQDQLNKKLHRQGYLFVNDVYRALGLPVSRDGQLLGWLWNSEAQDVVDFHLFCDGGDSWEHVQDYIDNESDSVYLAIRPRGVIINQI